VDRIVIMHPDSMAVVPEIPQSLSTVHSLKQGEQQISGYPHFGR
jgi:hypothetical protein